MTGKPIKLVFDFETIIDKSLLPKSWPSDKFPPSLMHQPVAISGLVAKCEKTEVGNVIKPAKLFTIVGEEHDMLRRFIGSIDRFKPQLVGFNSRSFDVTVLTHRAMIHGLAMKTYFQSGDKWNRYPQRYSEDWHFDIMDSMSNFRATTPVSLDVAATAVGLPGKFGPTGADVEAMYHAGKLNEIANYCETDVLNTYGVMLRLLKTTVGLGEDGFNRSADFFYDFVCKEASEKEHIADFASRVNWDVFLLKRDQKPLLLDVNSPKVLENVETLQNG
jgi:predicted PolB exonuclease-like 3'-5' exonuclease